MSVQHVDTGRDTVSPSGIRCPKPKTDVASAPCSYPPSAVTTPTSSRFQRSDPQPFIVPPLIRDSPPTILDFRPMGGQANLFIRRMYRGRAQAQRSSACNGPRDRDASDRSHDRELRKLVIVSNCTVGSFLYFQRSCYFELRLRVFQRETFEHFHSFSFLRSASQTHVRQDTITCRRDT